MEIGQPGAPAPRLVREAAQKALVDGRHRLYSMPWAFRLCVSALRQHYAEQYGVSVSPQAIAVTTGSSAGFNLAFLSLFEVGDRVILPSPGYPAYRNILFSLGLDVVEVETRAEDLAGSLTAEDIRRVHAEKPVKGVLIASPSNPSGTIMEAEALRSVVEICDELGIWFISDEIYHRLEFGMKAEDGLALFAQRGDHQFLLQILLHDGLAHWLDGVARAGTAFCRMSQSVALSLPRQCLSQVGGLKLPFDASEELDLVKAAYGRNRSFLMDALPGIGLGDFMPVDGAFLYLLRCQQTDQRLHGFCPCGHCPRPVLPSRRGADFDRERGHRYVRLSFAGTEAAMVDAVRRLGDWLR